MNPICTFSFNITAWNVAADKALSAEDWQRGEAYWAANAERWETVAPQLAFLPPLKRRRLSGSARLFFESAWTLTEENENLPVVYASSNGEINRSFELWNSLLKEGDVSPTSFSLSVHNALIGQWSEMRQVKNETTALAAKRDNLEIALLEASLLLNDGHEKVLAIAAETPLSSQYNVSSIYRQPFAYSLAMVVEKGNRYRLDLLARQAVVFTENFANGDNALTFVQQQHLQNSRWQTPASGGGVWQWQKS